MEACLDELHLNCRGDDDLVPFLFFGIRKETEKIEETIARVRTKGGNVFATGPGTGQFLVFAIPIGHLHNLLGITNSKGVFPLESTNSSPTLLGRV